MVHQVLTLFGPRDGSSVVVESSSEDLVIDSSVLVMVASSNFCTAGGWRGGSKVIETDNKSEQRDLYTACTFSLSFKSSSIVMKKV